MKLNRLAFAVMGVAATLTASFTADASHRWGNYHWGTTSYPIPLQVIDSNTPDWDGELAQTLSDWSQSTKLDLSITSRDDSSRVRKLCRAVSGKIRSCNASYGNNGWLGLASINISGSHITQGTSKMNDSYSQAFASQNQRDHVMCQEIGHLFGLGHTSEDGSSQGTCMDYSNSSSSTRPNAHDYDLLNTIYNHTESSNTWTASSSTTLTAEQHSMAGEVPMGIRVHKGVFHEIWVARNDRDGSAWIHHVTLAPGHEHEEEAHN